MARTPDHMRGISAIPKWDPNNIRAGYSYDPSNYSPADYASFKQEQARQIPDKPKAATATKTFSLRQVIANNEAVQKEITPPKQQKAKRANKPWSVQPDSVCIASMDYDGLGTLTIEFVRGGKLVYDYAVDPADARDAKEAALAGEAGEFFNDVLR